MTPDMFETWGGASPLQALPSLRVLQIGVEWFQGGLESGGLDRVYQDLLLSLPCAGVDATGVVMGPCGVDASTNGRVFAFGRAGAAMPERLWRARREVGIQLRCNHFDVVASHFALFTAPALDRMRKRPLVVHFHGPWAGEAAQEGGSRLSVFAKRAIEQAVYRRADRVIVLSRAFADLARDAYGVPEAKLRIVPGSVDVPRYATGLTRAEARERLGWPKDRRILLSVRRLAQRMGLDQLVTAMAEVARAEPDALLMIGGRGHRSEALRAQVASLGLADHVRFLGFVPEKELPLAFRAAEINVVPSVALEGFGLTAAEALASGTPSIVTPVGGLPDVVSPLSPDLVFASPSANDMADRLLAVLRGTVRLPDEKACRHYAADRFGALRSATSVAAVYREVA